MQRVPFAISGKRRYAVELGSLAGLAHATVRVQAVWFRRKDRVTAACIGYLWEVIQREGGL